jgi:hypothetical protein
MKCFRFFEALAPAAATLFVCASCAAPQPVVRPDGTPGPHSVEIEAASTLYWSGHRGEVFEMIAMKPDLTEHDQLFLINAILAGGNSDDQANAIATLVANPCLTPKARRHIIDNLDRIYFSSDRKLVVSALVNYPPDYYKSRPEDVEPPETEETEEAEE